MHKPAPPPDLDQSIRRGHEPTRVSFRAAVIVVIVLVVGAVLMNLLIVGVYLFFVRAEPKFPRSPLMEAGQRLPPPEPRLQPSASAVSQADAMAHLPSAERQRMDEEQSALVNGWSLDPMAGRVTIPVDQAMRLIAMPRATSSESKGGHGP